MMRMKRWEIVLAASVLAAILVCAFPIHAQQELAGKLTRLHVLANSDDPADQQLKLQVRDAVLAASAGETASKKLSARSQTREKSACIPATERSKSATRLISARSSACKREAVVLLVVRVGGV